MTDEFLKRIFSSVILLPLALLVIIKGTIYFKLL